MIKFFKKKNIFKIYKKRKRIFEGIAYIKATFNNTHITITDKKGNVISWATAGRVGFKNSKKSSSFAAQRAARIAGKIAIELGVRKLNIKIKGPGPGRESAARVLNNLGFRIIQIQDITPIPHNGCRPSKKRRI